MRARLVLPVALMCVLLNAAAQTAAPLTVRATGHPNWPPFSWERRGAIAGVGAQVAERVLATIGVKMALAPVGNWKRAQAEVAAGKVDLIVACYQTDERRGYMAFPATPYADDANVLWVAKGRGFAVRNWDDLVGKTGTAMLGESYGQRFDQFIAARLNVERVSTPVQNLQKLVMGRADYYPFSLYGGQIQVNQLGFAGRIEHLPTVISTEGVYLCVSKKSPLARYLPQMNDAIERLRADGTIDQLVRANIAAAAQP
jgi:polar amino acid transport system substrate-binding protein